MRRRQWLLALCAAVTLAGCGEESASDFNSRGNELHAQRLYGQALTQYKEAVLLAPDRPEPNINLGNTRYELRDYLGAIEAPKDFIQTAPPELQATIFYNQGNAHFRLQEYDKAIDSYKETLRRTPDDQDAKYNLELAQQIQQQQQQQQQQAGGGQQQPEQQPEQQPGQDDQQQGPGGQQPPQREPPPPSSMTPDEAERELDRLRRSEGRRSEDTYDNYAVGGDQGSELNSQPGPSDSDW